MKQARHVWLGVLLYLVFLVATAPASLLARLLPKPAGVEIVLQQPQGTLWRGAAQRVALKPASGGIVELGRLTWTMRWLPLLRGEAAADIELAGGTASARGLVAVGPGRLRVQAFDARFPANLLPPFFPALHLVQPGGDVQFHSESFNVSHFAGSGQAQLSWLRAESSLARLRPLGDYQVTATAGESGGSLQLRTLSGALQLQGDGGWDRAGVLAFRGTARALPEQSAELQGLLKLFGTEQADGSYRIAFNGRR